MSSLLATRSAIRIAREIGSRKIIIPQPVIPVEPPFEIDPLVKAKPALKVEMTPELILAFLFCVGALGVMFLVNYCTR
jgi:hypothetical protein